MTAATKYISLLVLIAALLCSAINPSAFVPSNAKAACCACCAAGGSGAHGSVCAMCQNMQRDRASCSVFPMPCRQGQSVTAATAPDIAFMHYFSTPKGVPVFVSKFSVSPDGREIASSHPPLFHPPCA